MLNFVRRCQSFDLNVSKSSGNVNLKMAIESGEDVRRRLVTERLLNPPFICVRGPADEVVALLHLHCRVAQRRDSHYRVHRMSGIANEIKKLPSWNSDKRKAPCISEVTPHLAQRKRSP